MLGIFCNQEIATFLAENTIAVSTVFFCDIYLLIICITVHIIAGNFEKNNDKIDL